ncbi:MAG: Mbov_0395 family pilin-like conjugal transfer protein [Candidatus Saccharimonadales bacterium]|jgi:hypothetical protein
MLIKIITNFSLIANPFPVVNADGSFVTTVLDIVFGIFGAVAVLFIVIGGFRYVISSGDPKNTAKAKNTIIYALVGLVITLSATAIVNFVAGKL